MTKVFISYAASDIRWPAKSVQALVEKLEGMAVSVSWDVGKVRALNRKLSSAEWVDWMHTEVAAADHVLCLVSSRYKEAVEKKQGIKSGYGVAFEASQVVSNVYSKKGNKGWAVIVHFDSDGQAAVVPSIFAWDVPVYVMPGEQDALLDALAQTPTQPSSSSKGAATAVCWGEAGLSIPVVLAGCGYWARNRTVLPLLRAHPELFDVVAITSLHPHMKDDGTEYRSKREEFIAVADEIALAKPAAGRPEFFADESVFQALTVLKRQGRVPEGSPLCVLINTPDSGHSALASEALNAGCHVYSERPAIAVQDRVPEEVARWTLEHLVDLARDRRLVFHTGVQRRLEPAYQYLERYVRPEEFGRLTAIRCRLASGRKLGGWRANPEEIGCGILMDEGYHLLDAGMWLLSSAYPDADMSALDIEVKNATLLQCPPYNPQLAVPTSAIGSVLLRVPHSHGKLAPVWLHFDLTYDASPRSVYESLELFSASRGFMRLYRNQLDRHPPRPGVVQRVQVAPENLDQQTQLWDSALDRTSSSFVPIGPPENPPNYGPLLEFFKHVQHAARRGQPPTSVSPCDAASILHTQRLIEKIVLRADRLTHAGEQV